MTEYNVSQSKSEKELKYPSKLSDFDSVKNVWMF